jgi:hypothetical protein
VFDGIGCAIHPPNGLRKLQLVGLNKAWKQKNPKARKMFEKRGDSQLSAARIVRPHALTEPSQR